MSSSTHTNPITGRTLKAENITALDQAMRANRFTAPHWATFQQWKGTGRIVRPGETGVTLEGSSGFQWRVFNVQQTGGEQAEAARAPAPAVARSPAAPARKAKPSARAGLKTVVPSGAPSAPAVNKTTGLPAGWERHPVTGHPMRLPAGVKMADAIPFGRDPKALAMVRREHAKHGRIGAANTLVMLELAGRKAEAANYRKGLTDRRRGQSVAYNYGPGRIDPTEIIATPVDAPAAPPTPAPVDVPPVDQVDAPAPVAPAAVVEIPAPAARASFRERWIAKIRGGATA